MNFICPKCGEEHQNWPAIAFDAPYHYNILSSEDKVTIAELDEDFCIIHYEDQTDRFIRTVLIQEVTDHCDTLDYGVWVSLSEKSFNDYKSNYNSDDYEAIYFGYLSNQIPGYDDTLSIKVDVELQKNGNRPRIFPHSDQEHDFVNDYYDGITKDEAEYRIQLAFD